MRRRGALCPIFALARSAALWYAVYMEDKEFYERQAELARANAYAPYSGYSVGACVVCKDGAYYTGCNVENASYGATMCAERNAVAAAVAAGQREIEAVYLVSSGRDMPYPCGICRQVLAEFGNPSVFVRNADGRRDVATLAELLPNGFCLRK